MIKYIFFFSIFIIEGICLSPTKKITSSKSKIIKNSKIYNLNNNEINKGYDYLKYLEHFEIIEYLNSIDNIDIYNNANTIDIYNNVNTIDNNANTIDNNANTIDNVNYLQFIRNFHEIFCTTMIILINSRLSLVRSIDISMNKNTDQIFKDTMNLYIPLAQILGLNSHVEELGNLSLLYLFPDKYYDFTIHILNLNLTQKLLKMTKLFKLIFTHEIKGRIKSIYSAWSKNENINEIYDLMAIRIIINSDIYKSELEAINECYKVLYTIFHNFYSTRTKDYIENPKNNGYKSIHTTIILEKDVYLEIQIRTSEMDNIANFGTACNYKYKKIQKKNL